MSFSPLRSVNPLAHDEAEFQRPVSFQITSEFIDSFDVDVQYDHNGEIVFTFDATDQKALLSAGVQRGVVYKFDALTEELKVETLRWLVIGVPDPRTRILRILLETEPEAQQVFHANFYSYYDTRMVTSYKAYFANNEMKHLMFRIVDLKFSRQKPFEKSPRAWAEWLRDFRGRSDTNGWPETRTLEALLYTADVLRATKFFAKHITFIICQSVKSVNAPEPTDDRWTNLDGPEGYRVRRALLLFQLYCELFHQPTLETEFGQGVAFNGRVSEQMSFMQSLHPWMLAELETVYGAIETILSKHFKICCVTRKSTPFQPWAKGGRASGPRMEWLISRGIVYLTQMIRASPFGQGRIFLEIAHVPEDLQNRFFSLPILSCSPWAKDTRGDGAENRRIITPSDLEPLPFPHARPGTSEMPFTWETYYHHTQHYGEINSPVTPTADYTENGDKIDNETWAVLELNRLDPNNIRCTIFWSEKRITSFYNLHRASRRTPQNFDRKHFHQLHERETAELVGEPQGYRAQRRPDSTAVDISWLR